MASSLSDVIGEVEVIAGTPASTTNIVITATDDADSGNGRNDYRDN